MVGEYVMRNLLSTSADKTFLGCAAVYDDGEFRYDIPTEIGINEAMIGRTAKELYILADHTKIKKREVQENSYGSCAYDRPFTLITDDNANMAVVERLRMCGTNVILVPTK
jgi:DeoR/GlpR family transcriptional regulator of sugar metabolism